MSQAASVDSAQGGIDRSSGFVRELGLLDSTMIVIGSMIGSGIFIVIADLSRTLDSPGYLATRDRIFGLMGMSLRIGESEPPILYVSFEP